MEVKHSAKHTESAVSRRSDYQERRAASAAGDCSSVMLRPSESGGTSQRGAFADRFGRGIGLQFIKRVGEWRPGREGRQEVIKVKVFEGQNVEFRAVVAGRLRGDGTTALPTLTGKVIVATITPDKLVRFWTSHGLALGNLDQEHAASPNPEIAARPLASWCMCVASNGVGNNQDQRVDGANDRKSDDDNDEDEDEDAPTMSAGFSIRPAATEEEVQPLVVA
ncbi:unnamed protein product [Laminaria digitata]